MKKKTSILAIIMCAVLAAAGCGAGNADGTEAQGAEAAQEAEAVQEAEAATEAESATTVIYEGQRSSYIDIDLSAQVTSLCDYMGIDLEVTGDYEVTDDDVDDMMIWLLSYYGADTDEIADADDVTDEMIYEYFASYGLETKDDFMEYVREELESQAESNKADDTILAVEEYVRDNSEVDVPDDYFDARMEELKYYTQVDYCEDGQTLEEYFEDLGTTLDEVVAQWEPSLREQIETEFLFERIAELEGIEIDDDKYESYVERLMSSVSSGFDDADGLYEYYGAGDAAAGEAAIKKMYLANEAMNYVTENANVTIVEEEDA